MRIEPGNGISSPYLGRPTVETWLLIGAFVAVVGHSWDSTTLSSLVDTKSDLFENLSDEPPDKPLLYGDVLAIRTVLGTWAGVLRSSGSSGFGAVCSILF